MILLIVRVIAVLTLYEVLRGCWVKLTCGLLLAVLWLWALTKVWRRAFVVSAFAMGICLSSAHKMQLLRKRSSCRAKQSRVSLQCLPCCILHSCLSALVLGISDIMYFSCTCAVLFMVSGKFLLRSVLLVNDVKLFFVVVTMQCVCLF